MILAGPLWCRHIALSGALVYRERTRDKVSLLSGAKQTQNAQTKSLLLDFSCLNELLELMLLEQAISDFSLK